MTKRPDVTTIATGYYSTTALNENFENIRDQFDNTLSLDGSTPNAMQADFDLNGYNLINANKIFVNGTNILSLIGNVTVSTAFPTSDDGNDGDVWFKVNT